MTILKFLRLGAALTLMLAAPALAQTAALPASQLPVASGEDALFTVRDVPVDVTAASAAAARDQAIADGQRAAFGQLLEKIGGEGFDAAKIEDGKIARLVRNFEITSEKASSVRYVAKLDVRFRPQAVRALLEGAGIALVTTPSRPVLLLPVSLQAGRPILWEDRTAWRTACENLLNRPDGLNPVIVPAGEINDIRAIGGADAMAGDAQAVAAIAANYNASSIVVAQMAESAAGQPLTVAVARYDENGGNQGEDNLTIPAAAAETQFAAAAQQLGKYIRQTRHTANSAAGMVSVTQPPAPEPVSSEARNMLPVFAPVASLPELTRLKQKLGGVTAVRHFDVIGLKRSGADLQISYDSDLDPLRAALAAQGLQLNQDTSGLWQLIAR